jgi:hypothetical protein
MKTHASLSIRKVIAAVAICTISFGTMAQTSNPDDLKNRNTQKSNETEKVQQSTKAANQNREKQQKKAASTTKDNLAEDTSSFVSGCFSLIKK